MSENGFWWSRIYSFFHCTRVPAFDVWVMPTARRQQRIGWFFCLPSGNFGYTSILFFWYFCTEFNRRLIFLFKTNWFKYNLPIFVDSRRTYSRYVKCANCIFTRYFSSRCVFSSGAHSNCFHSSCVDACRLDSSCITCGDGCDCEQRLCWRTQAFLFELNVVAICCSLNALCSLGWCSCHKFSPMLMLIDCCAQGVVETLNQTKMHRMSRLHNHRYIACISWIQAFDFLLHMYLQIYSVITQNATWCSDDSHREKRCNLWPCRALIIVHIKA